MKRIINLLTICTMTLLLGSCVHEFPEAGEARDVVLYFHHDIEWSYHDITVSRATVESPTASIEGIHARYHLMFYNEGEYDYPVLEKELYNEDLSREDFSEEVMLPPGNYEMYLWSDYADASLQKSFFFDSKDHSAIVYSEPYNGNNELRDAFRGYAKFSVQPTVELDYHEDVSVTIERPLARYEIVATDFEEFIQKEISRRQQLPDRNMDLEAPQRVIAVEDYKVKVKYTGYMPSKFNNFDNGPINSSVDVSYDAEITALSSSEARIGFDYVMVNGEESSVMVAVEIYNSDGEKIASSNSFEVPTKRSRNTTVRGKFLTSEASQGIIIDITFEGIYIVNI